MGSPFFENKCHEKIMFGAFPHRGADADAGTDVDSDSVSDPDYRASARYGSYSDVDC